MSSDVANASVDTGKLQDELDALNASITKQGSHVRALKKDGVGADEIASAISKLQALKIEASEMAAKLESSTEQFNRKVFDELLLRKMFVIPSFEIHGGVKGLFDLGPSACALKVSAAVVLVRDCDMEIYTCCFELRCPFGLSIMRFYVFRLKYLIIYDVLFFVVVYLF
jgi:WHEP-TRS domain